MRFRPTCKTELNSRDRSEQWLRCLCTPPTRNLGKRQKALWQVFVGRLRFLYREWRVLQSGRFGQLPVARGLNRLLQRRPQNRQTVGSDTNGSKGGIQGLLASAKQSEDIWASFVAREFAPVSQPKDTAAFLLWRKPQSIPVKHF